MTGARWSRSWKWTYTPAGAPALVAQGPRGLVRLYRTEPSGRGLAVHVGASVPKVTRSAIEARLVVASAGVVPPELDTLYELQAQPWRAGGFVLDADDATGAAPSGDCAGRGDG